jgi:ubiquitin-like 1-activating enzyme E1 B
VSRNKVNKIFNLNNFLILVVTPPNPTCYVCAAKPELILKIDTNVVTVKELRDDILIKEMNMVNPDVMLDGKGVIVISSDEDETECNESKLLKDMQIVDGCILKVDDFFQNYELTITIIHKTAEREDPKFEIVADKDVLKTAESVDELKKQKQTSSQSDEAGPSGLNGNKNDKYESDEDDIIMIEPTQSNAEKRKQADEDEDEDTPTRKKARIEKEDGLRTAPTTSTSATSTQNKVDDDDDLICIDDD